MVRIGNDWDELLADEWQQPYYLSLRDYLRGEYAAADKNAPAGGGAEVYPPAGDIFNAFRLTSYKDVRAVILGQDPYHEPGQAQGLAFSVPYEVPAPPSLVNIMKELADDLGGNTATIHAEGSYRAGSFAGDSHAQGSYRAGSFAGDSRAQGRISDAAPGAFAAGSASAAHGAASAGSAPPARSEVNSYDPDIRGILVPWARQGVLLLNTVLTVRAHAAGSHRGRGWETFTDRVIEMLAARREPMVFILWGSNARAKKDIILTSESRHEPGCRRHLIIEAPHPSPLSAYRGFFGGRYFSRTNYFLEDNGMSPIDWSLQAPGNAH